MKKFTLIELLVVVALIGVLITMLMPAIGKAREKSKLSVCMSNERQIGLAFIMWSGENDGKTLAAAWYQDIKNSSLTPFTGTSATITKQTKSGLYHCPSLNTADLVGTFVEDYRFTSYATNQLTTNYFGQTESPYWQKHGGTTIGQIVEPGRKVNFMESTHYQVGVNNYHPTGTPNRDAYNRWHLPRTGLYGKSNILWYDGHVTLQPGDFNRDDWQAYYFDPEQ